MKIRIKQNNASYYLTEDNEFECTHEHIVVEKACCSVSGSSGYIECGCGGMDRVECMNDECTGIYEWQFNLMEV